MAGEHVGKRALARAVRAHDGVHLAGADLECQSLEDLVAADGDVQVVDAQHYSLHDYPTAPSRLTARSCCASTANSIGSSLKTDLQKPLTIMLTASSSAMPRASS